MILYKDHAIFLLYCKSYFFNGFKKSDCTKGKNLGSIAQFPHTNNFL